jgi:hypothetical protein
MTTKLEAKTITVEAVMQAIAKGARSPTAIVKALGYKSGSSSVLRRLTAVVPDLAGILAMGHEAPAGKPAKGKTVKVDSAKGKTAKQRADKGWPCDPRNFFRQGSAYATCFDILAAHPDGLTREKLIELLAKATGKDAKHAAYDAQVLLSACGNDEGLNRNEGPRHRSCRMGFWVQRVNSHVKLMVD